MMWNYIKRYWHYGLLAALFMIGEVWMGLVQPELMSRIVDEGVLGLKNGGTGSLELIWQLGLRMIVLTLFGGLCGSLNNVFVHLLGQNTGNDMRKDCFSKIMTFSFPHQHRNCPSPFHHPGCGSDCRDGSRADCGNGNAYTVVGAKGQVLCIVYDAACRLCHLRKEKTRDNKPCVLRISPERRTSAGSAQWLRQ